MRAPHGSDRSGGDIGVAASACAVGAAGIYGATQTSQTGPIIAGVVAIIVALVTWYATDRRQDKALAAERERLAVQLRHERVLADVADFRSVVEDALAAFDDWLARADVWGVSEAGSAEESDARRALGEALTVVTNYTNRLQVRLGDSDPILEAWRDLVLDGAGDFYEAAEAKDGDAKQAAHARVNAAYRRLVESAKQRVGSRLEQDPPAPGASDRAVH